MKPRIRRDHGVWICIARYLTFAGKVRVVGHGYTPREAYADWLEQWEAGKR